MSTETQQSAAVMRDPDYSVGYWDFDDRPHCYGAGWDLSWGCRVTIGFEDTETGDDGIGVGDERLHATVSMSDEDKRRGITKRTVTPEQVRQYAYHLLALVGENRADAR